MRLPNFRYVSTEKSVVEANAGNNLAEIQEAEMAEMAKRVTRAAVVPARAISIRPNPDRSGNPYIVSLEVGDQVIDYAIDAHSASLLCSAEPYLKMDHSLRLGVTPSFEAWNSRI